MELPPRFSIDGKSFLLDELQEHSRRIAGDHHQPGWKREVMAFIQWFLDPMDGHLEQGTSGTTGAPKTAVLEKEKMVRSARRTIRYFGLGEGERALLCLPVRYIAGKMMAVRALLGGLDLVMVEPSGRPLVNLAHEVSFGAMVPLQVFESLSHDDDLSLIRILLVGGGELHPVIKAPLQRMVKPVVYESFATTETYTHFALKQINGTEPDDQFRLMEGVSIRRDERNCLEVEVPGVTTGMVATNDLVEINEQGNGFRWLGRYDNLINSGGIKIVPELLEQKIGKLLGQPCLVLPESDARLGQRLALMIEAAGKARAVVSWDKKLRSGLEPFEIPRRIVVVPSIPRNSSFKPDRTEAKKLLRGGA